ncbi:glycosyltransferase [Halovivax limisalsi]|uniref:glycosyltransferase n=1 Tax=Halovivax limisalsi TaxID=1453760 RepID=UPI001FFDC479|nr:glycosyltransferase [Halovivax limisalsi]
MDVSVVICTYSPSLYEDFCEAIESVLDQEYESVEVIAVVDGSDRVCEWARDDWGDTDRVLVHCNEKNVGLSASRNVGISLASGDVVAFMDDDAVAEPDWIAELVSVYRDRDVESVGGRMAPLWVAGKPTFLPEEFYWLVGVTHRGFPDAGPVRNTFGSNISFRTSVFERIGGFDESLGRIGDKQGQGEETDLATRLRTELGGTVYYNPDAVVGHKIYEHRTDWRWLLNRAFQQGRSKYELSRSTPELGSDEGAFLRQLFVDFVPRRVMTLHRPPRWNRLQQLLFLLLLTATVGAGYLTGAVRAWLRT